MAITKILYMKDCGKRYAGKHLKQAIDYITIAEKTGGGRYIGGLNCQPDYAYRQMKATKARYGKLDKRQGYHIIISFVENEVDPETAFEIIGRFAKEYLGNRYEAVYAVHDNTEHVHGHIILNSVSCLDGRKFRYEKGDWAKYIQPVTNRLCEEYGLSTISVENERAAPAGKYKEWDDYKDGKYVWGEMIKRDIDACIVQAADFGMFVDMMEEKGYEVKQKKYLAILPPGMKRFRRCKFFGEEYTEERIRQRIDTESLKDYREERAREKPRIVKCKRAVYIKRAKLSGLQKKYFAKLYRTGRLKKRPYSQAWKYRDEIRKLHKYHEQYMFLAKNDIHSFAELMAVCGSLEEKSSENARERSRFYKERSRFGPLFAIASKMKALEPAENSYRQGDAYFKEEHLKYGEYAGELAKEGFSFDEVEALREHYRAGAVEIRERTKLVSDNLRIANGILDELRAETTTRNQEMEEIRKQDIEQGKQPGR